MKRLGVFVTHPIQYYAPWFRYLAERMNIEVFYAHGQDAKSQARAGFGVEFHWDIPLLEGYSYRWLRNVAKNPRLGAFQGLDTPEVYAIVRREYFDAFLVFGWNRKSALQTIHACQRNGIPVLMRGDSQLPMAPSIIKRAAKYIPYRLLLPSLAAHLYVGQRNREYLQFYGVPEDRLFHAPHFVDSQFFAKHAREAERAQEHWHIRDELGISQDSFVFLFVGRLVEKKRPADFLQACLRLFNSPKGARMHAVFVGDGPLRAKLERLAPPVHERVHFAGFRNQSQLPAFYKAANALVLPSDGRETWGLVVNEAFACGVSAITSDAVGCATDLIHDGLTGYTYPLGNVAALAQRMQQLRVLCDKRPSTVHTALSQLTGRYSMENATKGLQQALESVA